ncbi:MAG: hypothetical protein OXN89_02750 [Bryobacterales bacterium]|nr:hypothetical protein [Bryobacterales bacterium]
MAVATDVFRAAARAQAAALGRPDLQAVYVPHPIQDQHRVEIEDRADRAVDAVATLLTEGRPRPGSA